MVRPVVNIAVSTRQSGEEQGYIYNTVILKYGIPLQEQIVNTNTIYKVKWIFDLETGLLEIPADCILDFVGGQIRNGNIHWDDTKILNLYKYEILHNINESGNKIEL